MITTCTIRNHSDQVLTAGTVLTHTQTDCSVLLTDFTTRLQLPKLEQPVILHLVNGTHGIRIFSAITESHTYSTIFFTNLQLIRTIQRRSDVKIKLSARLSVYPMIYRTDGDQKIPVADLKHEIAIDLADISAGGVGFYCSEQLDRDKFYLLRMPLTDTCIELKFVVVRRVDHPRGRHFYGCKFQQTPPPVEHALRSFIYRRGLFQSPYNL